MKQSRSGIMDDITMRDRDMTAPRYAIYFAPVATSDLWRRASRWLGRDAASRQKLEQPATPLVDRAQFDELTRTPALYGFHATLKPPMRLAQGHTEERLLAVAQTFANRHASISIPPLRVRILADFIALAPDGHAPQITSFAAMCVREFDAFRALPSEAEVSRRQNAALSSNQKALLARWGYPYVMEEFRFHMTLTGALKSDQQSALLPVLEEYFAPVIGVPLSLDAISIFEQPTIDSPFHIIRRFPLSGA